GAREILLVRRQRFVADGFGVGVAEGRAPDAAAAQPGSVLLPEAQMSTDSRLDTSQRSPCRARSSWNRNRCDRLDLVTVLVCTASTITTALALPPCSSTSPASVT